MQLYVGGQPYSLEQIEHEILRKMGEPRIHFAIVCASIGCPRLSNLVYVPSQVQQQLETNAKDFFSRSQNFRYDQRNRRFYLSSILSWFDEDFGSNRASQLGKIAQWLPTEAAQQAAMQNAVSVSFLDYNWKLNEQKSPRALVPTRRWTSKQSLRGRSRLPAYLWPDAAARKNQPPRTLCLITHRNGKHPVCLVTDLNKSQLSDRQAATIHEKGH